MFQAQELLKLLLMEQEICSYRFLPKIKSIGCAESYGQDLKEWGDLAISMNPLMVLLKDKLFVKVPSKDGRPNLL